MTDHLIAVDPGKKTGVARFESGRLVEAYVAEPAALLERKIYPPPRVVIENPRWYPYDHKDVNDLLDLAVLVGRYQQHFAGQGAQVELVWPRTWKGTAPKKVTNMRALAALSPEELAVVPLRPRAKDVDNNVADAIGLGLWKLGRLR